MTQMKPRLRAFVSLSLPRTVKSLLETRLLLERLVLSCSKMLWPLCCMLFFFFFFFFDIVLAYYLYINYFSQYFSLSPFLFQQSKGPKKKRLLTTLRSPLRPLWLISRSCMLMSIWRPSMVMLLLT